MDIRSLLFYTINERLKKVFLSNNDNRLCNRMFNLNDDITTTTNNYIDDNNLTTSKVSYFNIPYKGHLGAIQHVCQGFRCAYVLHGNK